MKAYQYRAIVVPDRGFLDDPEFLKALNDQGVPEGAVPCPWCGELGHAKADGFKHRVDQARGAHVQVILVEREVNFECASRSPELGKDTTTGKKNS